MIRLVQITTFRHVHFYLLFDVSSVTTLIVKKLLEINFFTNISIKVDIHITVTNKSAEHLSKFRD